MDLEEFLRQARKSRYFLDKGRFNDGVAYAVAACYHAPGKDEKPWLRDVRIDFLLELLEKLEST